MRKTFLNKCDSRGFTLIEIIVAITIAGLLVLLGTFGLQNAVDGYALARDNAQLSQKAQAALDRMAVEFSNIIFNGAAGRYSITAGNAASLSYTANFGGADENRTIALAGSQVRLDNIPLTDLVNGLQFRYWNADGVTEVAATSQTMRIISISLTMNGPAGTTRDYNGRVALQR